MGNRSIFAGGFGFCARGTMDLALGIPDVHFLVLIILDAMSQKVSAT